MAMLLKSKKIPSDYKVGYKVKYDSVRKRLEFLSLAGL